MYKKDAKLVVINLTMEQLTELTDDTMVIFEIEGRIPPL